jgi:protein-disulfide isomerase
MKTHLVSRLKAPFAALLIAACTPGNSQEPKKAAPAAPSTSAPSTVAPAKVPGAVAAPKTADPRTEAIIAWLEGFFPWGAGAITLDEISQVNIPGYRLVRAHKTYDVDARANDDLYAALEEGGKIALVGDVFGDEERMKTPGAVTKDSDLDSMRTQMKKYFRGGFRVAFDPALDHKSWKGLAIKADTGYGTYPMTGYISADGAILFMGRFWDRGRTAASQRRELINLTGVPVQGPADAKVSVVEFSDLQCPFCKRRAADWDVLADKLSKELKIKRYIKNFPLTTEHPWAFRAAAAGRCFFEVSPELFFRWKSNVYGRQDELTVAAVDQFALDFAVGNDMPDTAFKACYLQPKTNERILADLAEGFVVRVRSTPTYFIDGVAVSWFSDNVMEEFLRKAFLGGKGLPLPTPTGVKPTAAAGH